MKKLLLLTTLSGLLVVSGFAQTANYWSANEASRSNITKDKAVYQDYLPGSVQIIQLECGAAEAGIICCCKHFSIFKAISYYFSTQCGW